MNKVDIVSMKKIILENNTLPDLKKDMKELGFDFQEGKKGEIKAYNEALKYWKEIRESEFPLSEISRRKPTELSFTEVRDKRRDIVKIYGIVHNDLKSLSKDYIEIMNRNVLKEDSYCVKGLKRLFKEDGSERIKRVYCEEIDDSDVVSRKSKLKFLLMSSLLPLIRFVRHKTDNDPRIFNESSKDSSLYYVGREQYKRVFLPEPLMTERLRIGDNSYFEIWAGRSEFMARSLAHLLNEKRYKAKFFNNNPSDISISFYTGLGHEPQIEYYLKSRFEWHKDIFPSDLSFYRYEK